MRGAVVLAAGTLLLAACDSGTVQRDEVSSTRVVMRPDAPIPPGTVPRGTVADRAAEAAPPPDLAAAASAGRDRYEIFCTPCHGAAGDGDGPIVRRGFPAPPSLQAGKTREAGPEHIVAVITHGQGRMLPMADRVLPAERWAIAAYVKALGVQGPARPPAEPAR
jgi:mono/diheme cytochrome c family protein